MNYTQTATKPSALPPGRLDLGATAELLRLLADPTRVRLLSLLDRDELTVAELVRITQLGQSRISSHLARLKEAGLVRDRPAGASCFYALDAAGVRGEAGRMWDWVRQRTDDPLLEQDRERARSVLRARGTSWADSVAGQMERHYSPGRTWEASLRGLLGLVRLGRVLDVASGDGALAELVAPRARSVHCLDLSPRVVRAGRRRLAHLRRVHFHRGDMHALPFPPASFDQVLLMNALSYAERPDVALAEAARVLRPGGALAAVALKRHRHQAVAESYGHVQPGFEPDRLRAQLEALGFQVALAGATSRERRPPHFEVITVHAEKARARAQRAAPAPPAGGAGERHR